MSSSFTPYYAVIFTSIKKEGDNNYEEIAQLMLDLATKQVGFIGVESARNEIGITVSYWQSLEAIKLWKLNAQHQLAQKLGRDVFYKKYIVRVCKVEQEYSYG